MLAYQRDWRGRPQRREVAGLRVSAAAGSSSGPRFRYRSAIMLVQGCRGDRGEFRAGLACGDRPPAAAHAAGETARAVCVFGLQRREATRGRRRRKGKKEKVGSVKGIGPLNRF